MLAAAVAIAFWRRRRGNHISDNRSMGDGQAAGEVNLIVALLNSNVQP